MCIKFNDIQGFSINESIFSLAPCAARQLLIFLGYFLKRNRNCTSITQMLVLEYTIIAKIKLP